MWKLRLYLWLFSLLPVLLFFVCLSRPARAAINIEQYDRTDLIWDYDSGNVFSLYFTNPGSTTTIDTITLYMDGTCTGGTNGIDLRVKYDPAGGAGQFDSDELYIDGPGFYTATYVADPITIGPNAGINDLYISTQGTSGCTDKPRIYGVTTSPYASTTAYVSFATGGYQTSFPFISIDEAYTEYTTEKLNWYYPQDGDIQTCGSASVGNPDANWGLWYDLFDADDLGQWNILIVYYTSSGGTTYNDWEIVASTTELTYWTMDRTHNLDDGETTAWALISKIDDCDNYYDDDCVWTDIATTSIITFETSNASSCKDVMDYGLIGFTPATTTSADTEVNIGILTQVWQRMKMVFPLSIGFQIQDLFSDLAQSTTTSLLNIPLNTLVPDVMAAQIATSAVLFSTDTFVAKFPFWQNVIYPSLIKIVYAGYLIIIIYIIWPRSKKAVE